MNLLIEATTTTPSILLNAYSAECIISGRSYPKEAGEFYEPVFKWLDVFENTSVKQCMFQFKLEFLNTSSFKVILDILIALRRKMEIASKQLSIQWFYESDDEDMKENGETLMEMAKVPFEFISY